MNGFALEERFPQNAAVLEVFQMSHRKVSFPSLRLSQNSALCLYLGRTHSCFIDGPVAMICSSSVCADNLFRSWSQSLISSGKIYSLNSKEIRKSMLVAESNTELKVSKVEPFANMLCLFSQPQLLASWYENLEAEAIAGCSPASAAGLHEHCCPPCSMGVSLYWVLSQVDRHHSGDHRKALARQPTLSYVTDITPKNKKRILFFI